MGPTMTERQNREALIAKRNAVFRQLVDNPREIRLAIEIKTLDDQIAASTERMRDEEKKVRTKRNEQYPT
jgi:hypothetical protein